MTLDAPHAPPDLDGTAPDRTSRSADVVVPVAVDLDLYTAPAVAGQLRGVPAAHDVIVDLADVRFCDLSGVDVVWSAAERHRHAGATLRVRHAAPHVGRVFQMMGVADLLDDDRAGAGDDLLILT